MKDKILTLLRSGRGVVDGLLRRTSAWLSSISMTDEEIDKRASGFRFNYEKDCWEKKR